MDIKNIFIYNARPSDAVIIDKKTVKARGRPIPQTPLVFDFMRVTFTEDYASAKRVGCTDSLDSIHLDLDEWRPDGTLGNHGEDSGFPIYGRRRTVHIQVL